MDERRAKGNACRLANKRHKCRKHTMFIWCLALCVCACVCVYLCVFPFTVNLNVIINLKVVINFLKINDKSTQNSYLPPH